MSMNMIINAAERE